MDQENNVDIKLVNQADTKQEKHVDEKTIIEKIDPIVTLPSLLTQKSKHITSEQIRNLNLRARIEAATKKAWVPGHGLAAVQIGILLRYAWFEYKGPNNKSYDMELINPSIVKLSQAVILPKEGCLSIPDKWFRTMRYNHIVYTNDGLTYQASGKLAIIIQHEVDHMDGVLCSSRVIREGEKIGRNEPCPCGSEKKYKKCCLDKELKEEVKSE